MMKRFVVRRLVGLYPAGWRAEYGQEMADLLMAQPIGALAVADVVWNALRQQLRGGEPWWVVGLPLTLWALTGLILHGFHAGPFHAVPGAIRIQIGVCTWVGAWTVLREGKGGGRAALKMVLLVASPVIAAGLLATAGVLRIVVNGPPQGGFALAFSDPSGRFRAPEIARALIWAPIAELPFDASGWFGGLLARGYLRLRPRPGHV